jgi:hypothetical protein
MFWEQESHAERKEIFFEIQKTLCNHHRMQAGPHVHPETEFLAPDHFGPFLPVSAPAPARVQAHACA